MRKLIVSLLIFILVTPISTSNASSNDDSLANLITKTQNLLPSTNYTASYRVDPTTELQAIEYSAPKNTFKIVSNPTSYFTPTYIYTDAKVSNLSPFIKIALSQAKINLNKYDFLRSTTSVKDPGKLLAIELVKFYDQQLKNSKYTLTLSKNIYRYQISKNEDCTLTFSNQGLLTKINYRKDTTNILLLSLTYHTQDKLVIPSFKNNFDIQKFSTTKIFINEKYKYTLTQELHQEISTIVSELKEKPVDLNTYYNLLLKKIKYPSTKKSKGLEIKITELKNIYPYCASLVVNKDKTISVKVVTGIC